MAHLRVLSGGELAQMVSKRPGETKIGETAITFQASDWQTGLANSEVRFVALGIPEDIGVRANYGAGGTESAWLPSLRYLLNVQETDTLIGSQLAVLGTFDFWELLERSGASTVEELRDMVSYIDEAVFPVIETIVKAGKIPIVIGGGHNNSYPLLKGASKAKAGAVNCINLDAHSDYRAMEGRHSGNGFRYAKAEGYLGKYAVIGLHRNYNSQAVLNDLAADESIYHSFYEDIFLQKDMKFGTAINHGTLFTTGAPTGIELDLDCIENTLSSAASPCGITALQARKYVAACASQCDCAYLHLTEGAVRLADGRENILTAKLIAYLITDFMRAYMANY